MKQLVLDKQKLGRRLAALEKREREQARKLIELQETVERYKLFFHSSNDAVFVHQPADDGTQGTFVEVNDAACERYGYTREELLQLTPADLSTTEKAADVRKRIIRLMSEKQKIFETVHVTREGDRFPVEISSHLFSYKGKPTILSIVRDISDQKRAEEIFAKAFHASPFPMAITRMRGGTVVDVNKAFLQVFEFTKKEVVGRSIWDLNIWSEPFARKRLIERLERGKPVRNVEQRFVSKSGRVRWINYSAERIDVSGEPCILGIGNDVTVQRLTKEKLSESEERYRTLIDNVGIGVALISKNMEILTLNAQMRKWFPSIDVLKKPLCYRVFNNPPKEEVCAYCPTIKTLQDGLVHHAITETPAGTETRNYRIIASPIKDKAGKISAAIEMVEDITDYLKAREKLHTYQEQLRSLGSELLLTEERERRRLATDLHDSVGQLLAIAKLKLDTILTIPSASKDLAVIDNIRDLIRTAIQQTRSLVFELSPPVLYEFGLEAALEALCEQMEKLGGIRLEYSNDKQIKPLRQDVAVLLFRAARECLVNVVKHSQASRARLSVYRDGDQVCIELEDDGIGFEISDITSDDSWADKFGLFSIKERLRHLGGCFAISSEPSKGTFITLQAPLESEEPQPMR
ncbi:MAG: PAS domain S-box protein [Deltaproteobacteria bacterium]|nr:PAS domain S-box protein [Deltaproteobacteria bacterium]MBW2071927.1 PAS domain S-box protein [Deltaproteobacteria bacterium]